MKEKLYRIEQPKFPRNWEAEVKKLTKAQKRDLIDVSENPIYLYWDKIKYKIFKDLPVSHEVVWAFIINHR